MQYDPTIIHEYADKLYKKAENVATLYTVFGFFLGFFIGAFPAAATGPAIFALSIPLCVIPLHMVGRDKAFQYKLQAQQALCYAKIEENTRL